MFKLPGTATAERYTNVASLPGLRDLWSETLGAPEIRIAILDGPVKASHPCFDGARLTSLPTTVVEAAGNGKMSAHGTHIASMIFGQHGRSTVRGIAPSCSGFIVPIFSDRVDGPTGQLELARAINQAVQQGAHVINISGGELSQSGTATPLLEDAVKQCDRMGTLIVAAAGNDACRCLHVPAALPSVLAVGAMDALGGPLDTSNWGDAYRSHGVLAPGENMLGASTDGGVAVRSGTSFATPIVSGVAALLLSLQAKRGQKPSSRAVRDAILASALPCGGSLSGNCDQFLAGTLHIPGAFALISPAERTAMNDDQVVDQSTEHAHAALPGPGSDGASAVDVTRGELSPSDAASPPTFSPDETPFRADLAPAGIADSPRGAGTRPTGGTGGGRVRTASHRSSAGAVLPSCGCQSPSTSQQKVYAIGVLAYDFGTEARRDGFKQLMPFVTKDGIPYMGKRPSANEHFLTSGAGPGKKAPTPPPPDDVPFPANPYDVFQMVNYLAGFPPPQPPYPTEGGFPRLEHQHSAFPPPLIKPPPGYPGYPAHLSEASELIWTLNIELTPIYAIVPSGDFSAEVYQRLVEALAGQIQDPNSDEYVQRVSIPGVLTGDSVTLFSGQVVPVLCPQVRGMYAWNVNQLVAEVLKAVGADTAGDDPTPADMLRDFLDRIYYDLRNLGQTSPDRALNYSATNAFQAATILIKTFKDKLELDTIVVERSAFCRMDSDCWDVKLQFFNPDNVLQARKVFRFTVDVSDVFPVTVGPVRSWSTSG